VVKLTLGMDPSAEQLLVFLDRPPEMLLFASTLDNVCVLTRAMSALRTVSMNRLPAPEMVPLPHSDDDDDEAADDLVSSEPRPPLAPPVPALVPPLPPSLCPRKSLVLSFNSSHSECNKDVRVLNWKYHTDMSEKKLYCYIINRYTIDNMLRLYVSQNSPPTWRICGPCNRRFLRLQAW